MNSLKDFFGKFKRFTRKDEELRKRIGEVCLDVAHISIPLESVSFCSRIIYIDGTPVERNEILLHKEEILSRIRYEFPTHIIEDIR